MFKQTLLPDTLRAIKKIAPLPVFQKAYLAGGTALALQIGHRISVDLDFFTPEKFDERVLASRLRNIDGFSLEQTAPLTILGKIGETKMSLFNYPYKLVEETISFEGINLASKKDIAAMKIHALESRGVKRDFVDLFFLAKELSLEEMIEFYDQKYNCLEDHLYSILKSLSYFEDSERNELPSMLVSVSWDEIKKFFIKENRRLIKSGIAV